MHTSGWGDNSEVLNQSGNAKNIVPPPAIDPLSKDRGTGREEDQMRIPISQL